MMIVVIDYEAITADPDYRVTAWLSSNSFSYYRQTPNLRIPNEVKEHMTHLIITGGPQHSNMAQRLVSEEVLGWQNLPILGVCLGCMCIVRAFGGALGDFGQAPESIEVTGDGTLGTAPKFQATSAHREKITDTGVLKPVFFSGSEIVGVKHRDKPIFGVMFHPESPKTGSGSLLLLNFLAMK